MQGYRQSVQMVSKILAQGLTSWSGLPAAPAAA